MTAWLKRVLGLGAAAVMFLLQVAARLLSPFRLGRIVASVSIPRMREHRMRTAMTVVGVALGVAVLIAVAIVNRSILAGVASTVDDIAGKADLQVASGSAGFDEEVVDRVGAVSGVAKLTPSLQQTVIIRDPRARGERLFVLGVDFLGRDDGYFRNYQSNDVDAIKADPFAFLNSSTNIILSRQLADRLGYKLHDKIELATSSGAQSFEIQGFIGGKGVGSAFGGAVGVMYYPAMQVAFGRGRNIDRIDIALAPGVRAADVAPRLQALLGEGFSVERPARRNDRVEKLLGGMRVVLTMASVVALLVGVFLIYNTIAIGVVQRRREIGTLRALGSTRREVTTLFTLEGALLGGVGSALGVVLGIVISRVLLRGASQAVDELYMQVSDAETRLDPLPIVLAFVLGTLATTVTSALAARTAARVRPAETLRAGNQLDVKPPGLRFTRNDLAALLLLLSAWLLAPLPPLGRVPLGAFAASGALVLAGVLLVPRAIQACHALARPFLSPRQAIEAHFANQNVMRDVGRSATTAAALTVGVAMATSFATFIGSFVTSMIEWVDQTIPADMLVTNAANISGFGFKNVPMTDELYDEFNALPGVELVERLRIIQTNFRGYPIKLVAMDTKAFRQQRATAMMLEGTQEEAAQALLAGAVLVSESFSRHFDVHHGDEIGLSAKDGTRGFRVAGVLIDYQSDMGTVVIDRSLYARDWGDGLIDTYEIFLRKGVQPEPVRERIRAAFGGRYDLFILTNREFKAEITKRLDQMFVLMHVLELVAIIVAALGVVNALSANVLDRVREIGVLRAVGMLRKQTRKVIVFEALLLGCTGGLTGIAVGLSLGYVLLAHINVAQTGWYFPFRPSWVSIAELIGMVVVVSAAAAWYPARQASRLVVADALEYE